jgi:tetraacyldisaccharide-1-P 4'-kinase
MFVLANLKIGGGGKTTTTISLSNKLAGLKVKHAILCLDLQKTMSPKETLRRITNDSSYFDSSDEACLIAQNTNTKFAHVFICKKRAKAWQKLHLFGGFNLILSDDGWEDPQIQKAFFIRIISPKEKHNPKPSDLFPQGPYRSLLIHHSEPFLNWSYNTPFNRSGTNPELEIQTQKPINFKNQILAKSTSFTLITATGDPEAIWENLENQEYIPTQKITLRDHSKHTSKFIKTELNNGHKVVCTNKDWVRLDEKTKKDEKLYRLPYSLKLNYPIEHLLQRAHVKY